MSLLMSKFDEMESSYSDELYDEPILRKRPVETYTDLTTGSSDSEVPLHMQQEYSPVRFTSETVPEDKIIYVEDPPNKDYFTGTVKVLTYMTINDQQYPEGTGLDIFWNGNDSPYGCHIANFWFANMTFIQGYLINYEGESQICVHKHGHSEGCGFFTLHQIMKCGQTVPVGCEDCSNFVAPYTLPAMTPMITTRVNTGAFDSCDLCTCLDKYVTECLGEADD
jgi:hypothetical protein